MPGSSTDAKGTPRRISYTILFAAERAALLPAMRNNVQYSVTHSRHSIEVEFILYYLVRLVRLVADHANSLHLTSVSARLVFAVLVVRGLASFYTNAAQSLPPGIASIFLPPRNLGGNTTFLAVLALLFSMEL